MQTRQYSKVHIIKRHLIYLNQANILYFLSRCWRKFGRLERVNAFTELEILEPNNPLLSFGLCYIQSPSVIYQQVSCIQIVLLLFT